MLLNKIILAAAVSAAVLTSPCIFGQVLSTVPTTAPADDDDHEITEAERAKLEADSQADTTQPAVANTSSTTRPVPPPAQETSSRSYRSYRSSSNSGSNSSAVVLPSSYYQLMSRSIFIKGSQEVSDPLGSRGAYARSGRDDHPRNYFPATQSTLSRPETSLIFDGATHADGRFRALIEDTGTHAITPVSPGDRLASGTITALTLDTLDYTVGARTTRVGVGQNLDGVDAALGGAAAGVSGGASSPTPSSVTPSTGGQNTAAPAASNDILEKLKKRRQQELTGK